MVCFNDLGEHVRRSLRPGDRVVVTGRLDQHMWGSDPDRHARVVIIASDVAASVRKDTVEVGNEPGLLPSEPTRCGTTNAGAPQRASIGMSVSPRSTT